MNTYSPLEASIKLNISKRAVQKRCKKDNVRKKDNKYLITDLILDKWAKEIKSSVPVREPSNIGTQDGLKKVADIQELDLEEIENFEFKFKRDADFYRLGKFVFVPNDKIIIQYNIGEYERLKKEYAQAEDQIRTGRIKEETFKMLKTSLEEKIKFIEDQKEFYKEQIGFYQNMAESTLELLKLQNQVSSNLSKSIFIESTVKAQNTKWREAEPNKKGK